MHLTHLLEMTENLDLELRKSISIYLLLFKKSLFVCSVLMN